MNEIFPKYSHPPTDLQTALDRLQYDFGVLWTSLMRQWHEEGRPPQWVQKKFEDLLGLVSVIVPLIDEGPGCGECR